MKCHAAQRRLLEAEDPALPADAVRAHLAACPSCRDWQGRLLQLERHVPLLPVPAGSGPPADLLQRLERAAAPRPAPRPALRAWPVFLSRLDALRAGRLRIGRAAGVAAAVFAVAFVGWWAFRGHPEPVVVKSEPPKKTLSVDPLVKKLLQRDIELAKAKKFGESLEQLAYLAEDLHAETRKLADIAEARELDRLAALYEKIINDGVLSRAQKDLQFLPNQEKPKYRQSLDRLTEKLSDEERRAHERARNAPAAAKLFLERMADAARKGSNGLKGLRGKV